MPRKDENKQEMKVRPDYYRDFICAAEKCPFTCCQEWKIAVEEAAAKRWKVTTVPKLAETGGEVLSDFITWKEESQVIKLNQNHFCPFLNRKKLCELVCCYGDEMLSETCRVFPREIQDYGNRKEYTLMPSCPVVVDLLREREAFCLEETYRAAWMNIPDVGIQIRVFFMDIMNQKDVPPELGLLMVFYIALDLLEKEEAALQSLKEYKESGVLAELKASIEAMKFDFLLSFEERNELLLDMTWNYRKEGMYQDYLNEIAELAEKYSGETEISEEKIQTFSILWKEYETLVKNLLCEELFADIFLPGEGLEHMVVKLQWLAIEYAIIWQCLFFQWDRTNKLVYEDVRDYIVVVFRMTGYDAQDIYEYLENSFENLIWEWGYFALIVKATMPNLPFAGR